MAEKDYLLGIGQRTQNQKGVDVILDESVSDHKKKRIDREEEKEEAKHATDMAIIAKNKVAAEAAAKHEEEGPDFKLRGGVNIQIDPAKDAERAAAAAEKQQERADTAVKAANERAEKATEDLALQRYESLKAEFKLTTDTLLDRISKAQEGDNTDPVEKALKQLETLAPRLGFAKQEAGVTSGDDPKITLEITKMNIDEAQRQREFEWRMKQDDRNYDRQQRRDDAEVRIRQEEVAQKAKTFEILAGAPAIAGKAFAQGIMEKAGKKASTEQKPQATQGVDKSKAVTAEAEEFGTLPCPECQQPVALGPTATHVECANCGYVATVKREPNK